jgi:hypothetical protein
MKKVIVVAVVAGALAALPGSASAANICEINPGGTVYSSPGEMFADWRDAGFSPAQLAAEFEYDSVGDLIRNVCAAGPE